MIEAVAARELVDRLREVEERLERLLTSGWRQARAEAADLHHEADALIQAGLPELAARVRAVAEANDSGEALQAVALATSACRLLRARLPVVGVPDGWAPLTPSKPPRPTRSEALVPISRLLLDGREVWVCTRTNRNELLLVEPPFPPTEPEPAPAPPTGMLGRLRRQVNQALGGETREPSHWLNLRLAGTLHWQAQYPLGAQGDVGYWRLEDPDWVKPQGHPDEQRLHNVLQPLMQNVLQDGIPLFWTSGGFRIRRLDRDDPASYVWLDPTTADVFGRVPARKVWAITWMEDAAIVPVAVVTPGEKGIPPRLTHLIPGAPEDVLSMSR